MVLAETAGETESLRHARASSIQLASPFGYPGGINVSQPGATVDAITDDPSAYYEQTVTVSGEFEEGSTIRVDYDGDVFTFEATGGGNGAPRRNGDKSRGDEILSAEVV